MDRFSLAYLLIGLMVAYGVGLAVYWLSNTAPRKYARSRKKDQAAKAAATAEDRRSDN